MNTLDAELSKICNRVQDAFLNHPKYLLLILKHGKETQKFKVRLTAAKKEYCKAYLDNLCPDQNNEKIIKWLSKHKFFSKRKY